MQLIQEILDLFARCSGDYQPTTQEVEIVNESLLEILAHHIEDDMGLIEAAAFAKLRHEGMTRKVAGGPYIEHPMRVAGRVMLLKGVEEIHVQAAWLHDVIEDCNVTREELAKLFGEPVAMLVAALTNPSKQHEEMSRKDRKALDREHLAKQPRWVKLIKLVDRIDNVQDSFNAPHDWRYKYGEESKLLVERLYIPGDDMLIDLVNELRREIKKIAP